MTNPTDNPLANLTEYELHHLVAHLEAAGRDEDIYRLLALETSERRNAWYEARERQGQTAGYLADVACAWHLAEAQVLEGGQGVGLVIRYVFIIASLNSLAGKISPVLLAALVEKEIWTQDQGLAYAYQITDPSQQIEALARLVPHLLETERTQVLPMVLALAQHLLATREPEMDRVTIKLLANVAPHLPETECIQIFQEAWATAQAIDYNFFKQAFTLIGLAFHLPEPLLRPALTATREIAKKWSRVFILIALAFRLPEGERIQVLQEVLQIVSTMEDEIEKGSALQEAAAYLPEPILREALEMAQEIQFDKSRLAATQELVLRLAELGYPEEATIIAHNNPTPYVIIKLMPHLPEEEWREIQVKYQQELIEVMSDPVSLTFDGPMGIISSEIADRPISVEEMVEKLVSPLTEPRLWEVMAMVQEIADEESRAYWLTGLAPRLAELGCTEEALAAVQEITNKESQAKALVQLTRHLSKDEAVQVLQEALAAAKKINSEFGQANMLAVLAPHLPKSLLPEAIAIGRDITDKEKRAETLANLATHLPKVEGVQVLQEALAAAWEIADDEAQAKALAKLIFHLPEGEHTQPLQEALAVARKIGGKRGRAEVLAELAPHLAEVERAQILQEALAAAQTLTNEELMLTELARRLVEMGFSKEALRAVRKIGGQGKPVAWEMTDEELRAKVSAEMAADLSESEPTSPPAKLIDNNTIESQKSIRYFANILAGFPSQQAEISNAEEAMAAAREIEDETKRVYALTELAPHLPEDKQSQVLQEAVATARRFEDKEMQSHLLAEWVVPQLVKLGYYDEALAVARMIPDDWRRRRTLEAVHILADKEAHRQTLAEIVSQLPESFAREAPAAPEIADEMTRTKALMELAHRCVKLGYHKEALAAVREIVDRRKQVEILRDLASHLPRPFLYQALAATWEISNKKPQMKLIAPPTNLPYANLVGYPRADLLESLCQLNPLIIALGGSEAISETIRAIQDVGRWWP